MQQCNSAMVQQCNSDTVQQCKGAMVQQYYYISSNVTVQRCNSNTVCQCNNATVSRESFLPEWGFTLIPGVSDLESLALYVTRSHCLGQWLESGWQVESLNPMTLVLFSSIHIYRLLLSILAISFDPLLYLSFSYTMVRKPAWWCSAVEISKQRKHFPDWQPEELHIPCCFLSTCVYYAYYPW